jgi:hypothetical protein
MESKYLMHVEAGSSGYRMFDDDERDENIRAAIQRLKKRIAGGTTIVAIHVANPRYKA